MSQSSISDGNLADDIRIQKQEEEEKRFLAQLKALGADPYLYRKECFINKYGQFYNLGAEFHVEWQAEKFERVQKLGSPFIKAMDLGTVKHYSYSDLEAITGSFSERNFIGETRHGRLFQGKINNQDVIVKTWDFSYLRRDHCFAHTDKIIDELEILRDPKIKSHPCAFNLVGFHCDKNLAVVYEGIRPEYFLNDILHSDAFGWEDRMKVATDIGSMLKIFHDNNYVHGGAHSKCIMLDKQFCSKIFQFRFYCDYEEIDKRYLPYNYIHSGDLTREEEKVPGEWPPLQKWTMIDDIFSYGILLMELMTKQDCNYFTCEKWLVDWIYDHPKSVVDESLDVDEETASNITKLAFDCLRVKNKNNVELVDINKVVHNLKTNLKSMTQAVKNEPFEKT